MADLLFTGFLDEDLSNVANWDIATGLGVDTELPAGRVPAVGDTAWLGTDANTGSLICDHIYPTNAIGLYGGTYNAIDFVDNDGITLYGVTFNCTFTTNSASTNFEDGTYNGVVNITSGLELRNGTFNNTVYLSGASYTTGGTYNGPVVINDNGAGTAIGQGTYNDRVSFDSGYSFLYAVTSSAVAPPNKVLSGTSNLGVPGTASSGGALVVGSSGSGARF